MTRETKFVVTKDIAANCDLILIENPTPGSLKKLLRCIPREFDDLPLTTHAHQNLEIRICHSAENVLLVGFDQPIPDPMNDGPDGEDGPWAEGWYERFGISLESELNEHPDGETSGYTTQCYRTDSHSDAQFYADWMHEFGWEIWIVSNTGQPGFVVYKKNEPKDAEKQ